MYKIRIPIFLNKNIEKYERIKPGTCCVWKNIAKKNQGHPFYTYSSIPSNMTMTTQFEDELSQ